MDGSSNELLSPRSSTEERFLRWLVARGRLDPTSAERVARVQSETTERLAAVLLKLGTVSEAVLAAEIAGCFGLAQAAAESPLVSVPLDAASLSESFLWAHELVVTAVSEAEISVACWDALQAVAFATMRSVKKVIATRSQIQQSLLRIKPVDGNVRAPLNHFDDDELDRLKDLASEAPVIRLVQRVIDEAVRVKASDIHFEVGESALQIRFRTDGLLREAETHPREIASPVVSRIKVMAGINIAERRLPQDGRIRVTVQGKDIDFRVATAPTLHGESVVMRILDRQDIALDFDALGFDASTQSLLRAAISRPHGIVLVTGPTGSGKTTTLYAALKEINTPDKKILTIEDPVEYMLSGVNQVAVRPQIGLTFASALRSFLRQDPDVMMVGEIRDRETAEIAIQAALTGHLVLSTLHTNTAAAAVARLIDMGIDDYLLTSTVHLVIGQRLVRKLCELCKQPYKPGSSMRHRLGIGDAEEVTWYRPAGCERCFNGYKSRTTIVEALPFNDAVRACVLSRADAHQIEEVATQSGMRTLFRHGAERVTAGLTTAEEVLRVTSMS